MKFQAHAWMLGILCAADLSAQPVPTARVAHAPVVSGRIEGSLQALTAENIVLNGDATITGDLLMPGSPEIRLNGKVSYGGTREGAGSVSPEGYAVTLNGGAALGHVVRRTDAVALPLVSPPRPPAGTRSVSLDAADQSAGDFATLRDLTLGTNVGSIAVPAGAYNRFEAKAGSGFILGVAGARTPSAYDFQSLTLPSGSTLQLTGPVIITLGGDFSPRTNIGVAEHPGWLKLRLASGGLLLAGNVIAYGALEAPAGSLSLGGAAQFTGSVAADRLEMNGRSVLRVLILNQPPTVDVAVPAEGAVLPDNVEVAIFANAGDADGSVTRVEFYDGPAKLGETARSAADGSVFRFTTRLVAGAHALTARAIDDAGAATDSSARSITVQAGPLGLPAIADFEPGEGYQPGPLHGQKGWAATSGVKIASAEIGDSRQSGTYLMQLLSTLKTAGYRVHLLAHSQGNVVAGEALSLWKALGNTTPLVSTYIASQGAIPAHCYDATLPSRTDFTPSAPNVYGRYWTSGDSATLPATWGTSNPSYLATNYVQNTAGRFANFYNPDDYALTGNGLTGSEHPGWMIDQRLKPDVTYGYTSSKGFNVGQVPLRFPDDHYQIFSYAAPAWSFALGATSTGGVFNQNAVNLKASFTFGSEHLWHSGEFRSYNAARYRYWMSLLDAALIPHLNP